MNEQLGSDCCLVSETKLEKKGEEKEKKGEKTHRNVHLFWRKISSGNSSKDEKVSLLKRWKEEKLLRA